MFLSSRNPVLNKSWVSDLWCRVIQRALDDIILFERMHQNDESLTEENMEDEQTAHALLFDETHRIPMDDYLVKISCPQCKKNWQDQISKIAGCDLVCPACSHEIIWKYLSYETVPGQDIKDIALQDLLECLGIEDIHGFRAGCKEYIQAMSDKEHKARTESRPRKKRKYTKRNKEYWDSAKRRPGKSCTTTEVNPLRVVEMLSETEPVLDTKMLDEAERILTATDEVGCSPGNEDGHYFGKIQPIDFIEDQQLGHHEANVVKYICRWKRKGGMEDLKKAVWFLHRLIRLTEKENG